jgi:heme exporter protein A
MNAKTPLPPRPLRVSGLAVARAERTLFAGIAFTIEPGGVLLVRGPNGAGKSSLLLALAGILRPEAGQIEFSTGDERPGEAVHFLGHLNAVKPRLTLAENLKFWVDLYGGFPGGSRETPSPRRGRRWREAPDEGGGPQAGSQAENPPHPPFGHLLPRRGEGDLPIENGTGGYGIANALEIVGLGGLDRHDAGHLSQGQTRRLALARLGAIRRPIWLLDEPTAALDTGGEDLVAQLIRDHRAAGGIAVIATHHDLPVGDVQTLTLGAA